MACLSVSHADLSSSPALRGSSSKRYFHLRVWSLAGVIIPCVAGQFFEAVITTGVIRLQTLSHHPLRCGAVLRSCVQQPNRKRVDGVIIPCVAGQFFEGGERFDDALPPCYVIIPCVAGQFFEARSRARLAARLTPPVIIPCVAGQFFEAADAEAARVAQLGGHHPLRCGAVLRRLSGRVHTLMATS